jgi:uncharacterized membrane protein YdbT with pleckstrin-like domain
MNDAYLSSLLGDREKILLVTHQHWFIILRSILVELILIAATIVAVTLVLLFWAPDSAGWLGYFLLLIPLASLIRDIIIWQNHKYVVTDRRVIQIFGVFNKNVTDSSLEKVNDVKMDQSFFGRIFDFGDIEILTASELGINRFTSIGDPVGFKTAMINAKYKLDQSEQPYAAAPNPMMDIPRLIEQLDELRMRGALTEEEFREKKSKLLDRI